MAPDCHAGGFAPTMQAALARLGAVRAHEYARTRNAISGAVSRLSPYITHGFVSVPQVARAAAATAARLDVQHKFIYELGWREYFQHAWQQLGDGIFSSLHAGPLPDDAYARCVPADVRSACTGVPAIDQAVRALYATGYLHNHARMWLASYLMHVRRVHWRAGADWMIAHLLDGDLASNHLSWQWVAGTGSHKPYLFNADNVAKYAPRGWWSPGSSIDTDYATLERMARGAQPPAAAVHDQAMPEPTPQPAVSHQPPDGVCVPVQPRTAAAVWLVHPWNLGEPPQAMRCVAVFVREFHERWPWSAARWRFVSERMAQLTDTVWHADAATVRDALRACRVHTRFNPHLAATGLFDGMQAQPVPTLFAPPATHCSSFSQFWSRVTRGAAALADLPGFQEKETSS
jgi:deoxyribodipyrimidine photo-lyase